MIGLTETPEEATRKSQAIPKIGFFAPPQAYRTLKGVDIDPSGIDILGRVMTMGSLHKSMAVSCPMAVAGAAAIQGTVIHEMIGETVQGKDRLNLGHPSGIFDVEAKVEKQGDAYVLKEAAYGRTARRLMEGCVLVPDHLFN